MDMKGSMTEQNLMKAFAGESQAATATPSTRSWLPRRATSRSRTSFSRLRITSVPTPSSSSASWRAVRPSSPLPIPRGRCAPLSRICAGRPRVSCWSGDAVPGFRQDGRRRGVQEGCRDVPEDSRGGGVPRAPLPATPGQRRGCAGVSARMGPRCGSARSAATCTRATKPPTYARSAASPRRTSRSSARTTRLAEPDGGARRRLKSEAPAAGTHWRRDSTFSAACPGCSRLVRLPI